jgi:hypothetical protein
MAACDKDWWKRMGMKPTWSKAGVDIDVTEADTAIQRFNDAVLALEKEWGALPPGIRETLGKCTVTLRVNPAQEEE